MIETRAQQTTIDLSLDVVIEDVMVDLGRQFKEVAVTFARHQAAFCEQLKNTRHDTRVRAGVDKEAGDG